MTSFMPHCLPKPGSRSRQLTCNSLTSQMHRNQKRKACTLAIHATEASLRAASLAITRKARCTRRRPASRAALARQSGNIFLLSEPTLLASPGPCQFPVLCLTSSGKQPARSRRPSNPATLRSKAREREINGEPKQKIHIYIYIYIYIYPPSPPSLT